MDCAENGDCTPVNGSVRFEAHVLPISDIMEAMAAMQWTHEAEHLIRRVPFFVRKKVRQSVEQAAINAGERMVTLTRVKATQQDFLRRMPSKVKGYQLDTCFGPNGCPNCAVSTDSLMSGIERCLQQAGLLGFLKAQLGERLKFHHEFRISVAACPNACSQPQIKDIGIIGACLPQVTSASCSACGQCVKACPDEAITIARPLATPLIEPARCMTCGRCAEVCPSGSIVKGIQGYRVLVGGKLGRHPRLASQLPGIYGEGGAVEIVRACLGFYKENSRNGERLAAILNKSGLQALTRRLPPPETLVVCNDSSC